LDTHHPIKKHFESIDLLSFAEGYLAAERLWFWITKSSIFKFDFDRSIKREEALEKMKRPAYNPETIDEEFKYIATKLELKLMVW
jgi:hypothetical protein